MRLCVKKHDRERLSIVNQHYFLLVFLVGEVFGPYFTGAIQYVTLAILITVIKSYLITKLLKVHLLYIAPTICNLTLQSHFLCYDVKTDPGL